MSDPHYNVVEQGALWLVLLVAVAGLGYAGMLVGQVLGADQGTEKMRKIGEAFFGRQAAYMAALEASDPEPLVAALTRNVFDAPDEPALGAPRLAAYMREAASRLAQQHARALERAEITFPHPEGITATDGTQSRDGAR